MVVTYFFAGFHVELGILGEVDVLFGAVLVTEDMSVRGSGLNSLVGIVDLLDEVPVRSECVIVLAVGVFRMVSSSGNQTLIVGDIPYIPLVIAVAKLAQP